MQLMVSSVCMLLTATVVGNAYYQKRQFYPAVVYITKSNASMAVIYIQFFVIVFMCGKLLRKIFLGTLRAAEFEHLLERFWYALTETCLAFTVFRDDFNPRFVALFTVLLFLKSFHWLSEERVDFMERSPVISWLFHIRVVSLLTVLGVLDYMLLMHAYNSTLVRGPTVQLVFGFEYAILLTMVANTAIKYVLHTAEMRTDAPWENKAIFLLYTELVIGLIKVVLYVLFVIIMAKIYALPMFVFRPMFFTIRNFKKALSDVIMSRRAIRNMNTLYPDATPEELRLSDNLCIICREEMVNSSKKLPCGHIFHTNCLRSWFQRQQTCPTCRLNILRTPATQSTALPRQEETPGAVPLVGAAAAGAGVAAATAAQPHIVGATETLPGSASVGGGANPFLNLTGNLRNNPFADFQSIPVIPPPTVPHLPPAFLMPPQFPFMTPYNVPMPPLPDDLTNFSDEQLRAMEGQTRQNIEERLKLLQQITTLINATEVLMANYRIACANSPAPSADSSNPSANATSNAANAASATATATTLNDGPTTSAAAALVNSQPHAAANVGASAKAPNEPNKVTIEDLGMEENELEMAASATGTQPHTSVNKDNSAHAEETTELCELRKRRLKFLEDKTQATPTTD